MSGPTIDGSGATGSGSSPSFTASAIATSLTDDVIVVDVTVNTGSVSSITSSPSSLSFTQHSSAGSGGLNFERWIAHASAALSSETLTINISAGNATVIIFAVNGSDVSSYPTSCFDSGSPQTSLTDPISITTHNANTLVVAGYRTGTFTCTAGTGFTSVVASPPAFTITEYIPEATATTVSCVLGTGAGTAQAGIADAFVPPSGVTLVGSTALLMM